METPGREQYLRRRKFCGGTWRRVNIEDRVKRRPGLSPAVDIPKRNWGKWFTLKDKTRMKSRRKNNRAGLVGYLRRNKKIGVCVSCIGRQKGQERGQGRLERERDRGKRRRDGELWRYSLCAVVKAEGRGSLRERERERAVFVKGGWKVRRTKRPGDGGNGSEGCRSDTLLHIPPPRQQQAYVAFHHPPLYATSLFFPFFAFTPAPTYLLLLRFNQRLWMCE